MSDDERREVARRLRENAEAHPNMSLILNLAFADDSLKPDGSMEWRVTPHDAAMRLADLIEPDESGQNQDTVQKESPAVQKAPEFDRDALLALADELDGLGLTGFSSGWSSDAVNVGSFARRIREALGVQDA